MPTYEYLCEKCGHEFEREQRITDPPIRICPECQSRKVKKLISRTSFVLKGGGWYADLYSSSRDEKRESPSQTSSTSETSTPSEAKKDSSTKTESSNSKKKTAA